jgi:cytochrome b
MFGRLSGDDVKNAVSRAGIPSAGDGPYAVVALVTVVFVGMTEPVTWLQALKVGFASQAEAQANMDEHDFSKMQSVMKPLVQAIDEFTSVKSVVCIAKMFLVEGTERVMVDTEEASCQGKSKS